MLRQITAARTGGDPLTSRVAGRHVGDYPGIGGICQRSLLREKAGAVVVLGDAFFNEQRRQIAELAAKNRLPAIAANGEYVEAGVLMSYGGNRAYNFRRAATYVDKIFKGAKPGDLPGGAAHEI